MKVHDALIGAVLLVLSLVVLWQVQSFPMVPGQPYGAGLFPGLAAAGLGLCSLALIVTGLRRRPPRAPATDGPAATDTATGIAGGSGQAGSRLPWLLTVGAVVFYILASPYLGFVVCAAILLAVLLAAYGVRPVWVAPIALVTTLVIHTAFYRLLKVPLPWGLLQPIAW